MRRLIMALPLVVVLATGCSQSSSAPTAGASPDAAQIVAGFKTAGLPVGTVTTYTAANDPNHLLGRPDGYVSKTAWVDTRVDPSQLAGDDPGSVDAGGSVEVFSSPAGAQDRASYIQGLEKGSPLLGTEYDYVVGDDLVRVSGYLTPDQAAAYKTTVSK